MACSSSDDSDQSSFQVTVTQDLTTTVIDEVVTLTATASDTISSISFSLDGGETFPSEFGSSSITDTANLYVDFDALGENTVIFRVKSRTGVIVDTPVSIMVERGDAVKLESVQLNSFFNINETWDNEFSSGDPNRLADVFFVFLKPSLNPYTGERTSRLWYTSTIDENQGDLQWNLTPDELYIDPGLQLRIAFADADGEGLVDDLMLGPPFDRLINLGILVDTQPNSITLEDSGIDLEYTVGLDW